MMMKAESHETFGLNIILHFSPLTVPKTVRFMLEAYLYVSVHSYYILPYKVIMFK